VLALRNKIWKENYRTRVQKNQTVKHSTHPVRLYMFYLSTTTLPYKPYICTEGSFWNRRLFKIVTVSSMETQFPAESDGTADSQ